MAKTSIPILVDWESIKDYLGKANIVEVIRCKECIKKPFCTIYQKTNDEHGYCSLAVRPVTCDCCKYWDGSMRDGRYWCNKHSTYMDTGCKEGRRNEFNPALP